MSVAPGLRTNGRAAASGMGKTPSVTDSVEMGTFRSTRTYTMWAVAGLALAGAVAGHVYDFTPSVMVAEMAGNEDLATLRELEKYGSLRRGGAEGAFRRFTSGAQGERRSLLVTHEGKGEEIPLDGHGQAAELLAFFEGEHRYGLSEEEFQMAVRLSTDTELERERGTPRSGTLGINLARGLRSGDSISFYFGREKYEVHSRESLRQVHDFFYAESPLNPREQRLLWAVRLYAGYNQNNPLELMKKVDAGEDVNVDYYGKDGRFTTTVKSRAELFEFAERLLGQIENEGYQPLPSHLIEASRRPLAQLSTELGRVREQFEVLRGLHGINPEILRGRLERLSGVESRLAGLRSQIENWEGGDGSKLRTEVGELIKELEALGSSRHTATWDPFGPTRAEKLVNLMKPIYWPLELTKREPGPRDWTPRPALEGRYQRTRDRGYAVKLERRRPELLHHLDL